MRAHVRIYDFRYDFVISLKISVAFCVPNYPGISTIPIDFIKWRTLNKLKQDIGFQAHIRKMGMIAIDKM